MDYAPQSSYYHAKESCYLCGKTDDLVDTAVQIEGEGVLALCRGCILGDMALTLGVDVAALELAAAASADLEREVAELKAALRAARRTATQKRARARAAA